MRCNPARVRASANRSAGSLVLIVATTGKHTNIFETHQSSDIPELPVVLWNRTQCLSLDGVPGSLVGDVSTNLKCKGLTMSATGSGAPAGTDCGRGDRRTGHGSASPA